MTPEELAEWDRYVEAREAQGWDAAFDAARSDGLPAPSSDTWWRNAPEAPHIDRVPRHDSLAHEGNVRQ
jgi:hypothetical protein